MAIQTLRGFRDFYPEDQAKITYLRTKIADVCARFGYEEFEGPALESFELYAAKSSDEIVNEQAFVFEDRGGDRITLRPELTPTLARMVAARQNQLTFPIRWWSFGRFWRYERPQKGRAREFYQWNLDLLGDDSIAADVEILEILIRFLQSLGLTAQDAVFELSDRGFASQLLAKNGIAQEKVAAVFRLVDRLAKLDADTQRSYARDLGLSDTEIDTVLALFAADSTVWQQSERLTGIMRELEAKGLGEWAKPNLTIVRGFNYYTGVVFEVSDRAKEYRAMLGGGRYANLVSDVGGQPLGGIGMGMGDMVILSFLESKGLLPAFQSPTQICVVAPTEAATYARTTTDSLRNAGFNVISITTDAFGKGLKFASQKGARFAILLGPNEAQNETITVKNLETGEQQTLDFSAAVTELTGTVHQ